MARAMRCTQWEKIPFQQPGRKSGIFSSSCEFRGQTYRMQITCGTQPGQGCYGYILGPDGATVGPVNGPNLRRLSGELHSVLDWYGSTIGRYRRTR